MPNAQLPERPSLEYLKKLAKEHLTELRRSDPHAKLASALLAVARDHGFPSWRSLKAEVESRLTKATEEFFEACDQGDTEVITRLLANEPGLVTARNPRRYNATGLHATAVRGHLDAVQLLLARGADPNARETGDDTYPLHWAAARGCLDVVRALLDAGGDVHGFGDDHAMDVIGWATCLCEPGDNPRDVLPLLLERGAKHHIFSAITVGDPQLIQKLVEENPEALDRRMSPFENGQTPLHFAINRKRRDLLELLIELGADLEATDKSGQTAMNMAMLRGDREAMSRLHAAGAKQPEAVPPADFRAEMAKLVGSVKRVVPLISVPDVAAALDWYVSIGFQELGRYEYNEVVNFGMVGLGEAEIMLNLHGKSGPHDVSLWLHTDRIDEIYQTLKARQLQAAQSALAGDTSPFSIEFEEDLNDTFYHARQFGIRDLNGYVLYFIRPSGST
ncbi:ankyrin repeat domain-containing protein [Paludibaculum fermentans]|uniref:Ankyrin repeat domain-containing protein n=1 Tax=Paludibaculum fermentans TaxID=1473598 RepID=A0A7S7NRE3_PALFE|nr:ankyrin repeat domain-containing protein [Paludibaculum fermentans]QOY88392.1 ankyrin repeat domain-containing protein [Paludibaculum fermentans]